MRLDINNYPGSKNAMGLYQWIINNVPEFGTMYDMFSGSGVVTKRMKEMRPDLNYVQFEIVEEVYDQLIKSEGMGAVFRMNSLALLERSYNVGFFNLDENAFMYLDPPYIKSTRRSGKDIYGNEWNDNDHLEFLELILEFSEQSNFNIMISHYDHPLYREMLQGWPTDTFTTMTRGGKAEEKIWMNYDNSSMKLASYNYLGNGFSDRQRVKRRKESFLNKLLKMPFHEQQAILEHINKNIPASI